MQMAFIFRNNDDEVWEGDRYYWKITNLLQNGKEKIVTFRLHRKTLQHHAFVCNRKVYVNIRSLSRNDVLPSQLFDLRAGIVGDDLREIVALKPGICLNHLVRLSQLSSTRQSNKALYLFIEIKRKDESLQKMKARKEQIETDYRDLLLSGKNSDVTLEVKNKKFYCHRCILAARSPIFAAMMENGMGGNNSGDVIIEDADPDVFSKFLLFLYTGKEDYISWQNVTLCIDLYKLADKYGVEDIKSVLRNDMKEDIRESNFCKFLKLSLLHNDLELLKKTVKFFLKHSKEIVVCKNWATFLSEGSMKWLSVDYIKESILPENFLFFFKLSQIQNDSELTETTVQFFLRKSKDIIRTENWITFLAKHPVDANVLITALADK